MIKSKFDWDKFKTFYYIAQAGSFTRASEILNTSQPALSRTIQGLEEQIGVKLFTRGSRGVILTSQGQTLFQSLTRIHQEFVDNELFLQQQNKQADRTLRVGLLRSFASPQLINDISSFIDVQPDIQLSIFQFEHPSEIFNFKAEVALLPIAVDAIEDTPDLIPEYVCALQKKFYASAAYLDQWGRPETAEDLSSHRLILYDKGTSSFSHPTNESSNSYVCMNSYEGIQQAAESGYGIAPLIVPKDRPHESSLIEVLPEIKKEQISLFYIYPSCLKSSPKVKKFGLHIGTLLRDTNVYPNQLTTKSRSSFNLYEPQPLPLM